jgi:hypothetical protein
MANPLYRDEPLVTVAWFATSFEASLARGALEAAGIPAMVPDESLGTFSRRRGPGDSAGPGSTVLQVFASDRHRAVAELRRLAMHDVKNDRR